MIAGLVLAAGAGSRLGQPKAPLVVRGERLVDRAVRLLREGGCHEIFVVLGAWQGEVPGARVVINGDWASGMGSSLRAGLEVLTDDERFSAAVVTLVDLPGLSAAAVRAVVAEPGELVVATYEAKPGHPLKLGRAHWPGIMATLVGDAGARDYLRNQADVVSLELSEVGHNADVDTPADLAALEIPDDRHR